METIKIDLSSNYVMKLFSTFMSFHDHRQKTFLYYLSAQASSVLRHQRIKRI